MIYFKNVDFDVLKRNTFPIFFFTDPFPKVEALEMVLLVMLRTHCHVWEILSSSTGSYARERWGGRGGFFSADLKSTLHLQV